MGLDVNMDSILGVGFDGSKIVIEWRTRGGGCLIWCFVHTYIYIVIQVYAVRPYGSEMRREKCLWKWGQNLSYFVCLVGEWKWNHMTSDVVQIDTPLSNPMKKKRMACCVLTLNSDSYCISCLHLHNIIIISNEIQRPKPQVSP